MARRWKEKVNLLRHGCSGAGKTLAGLNIATKRAQEHSDEHAVFLSETAPGHGAAEALARDEAAREGTTKTNAHRKVSSFIQNIHHFRDEALNNTGAPHERSRYSMKHNALGPVIRPADSCRQNAGIWASTCRSQSS
ncbi:DNA/RNA helicase domain-containing protein [Paracoccus marcusii]|uniref:DNA/RNA helicase domain-containing protein n=1 Tax=Paracoccus marcusii TaxID=59779 RepID=UPI0039C8A83E